MTIGAGVTAGAGGGADRGVTAATFVGSGGCGERGETKSAMMRLVYTLPACDCKRESNAQNML